MASIRKTLGTLGAAGALLAAPAAYSQGIINFQAIGLSLDGKTSYVQNDSWNTFTQTGTCSQSINGVQGQTFALGLTYGGTGAGPNYTPWISAYSTAGNPDDQFGFTLQVPHGISFGGIDTTSLNNLFGDFSQNIYPTEFDVSGYEAATFISANVVQTPEPSTLALGVLGGLGLAGAAMCRRTITVGQPVI